jgi:hypothetical protein
VNCLRFKLSDVRRFVDRVIAVMKFEKINGLYLCFNGSVFMTLPFADYDLFCCAYLASWPC